MTKKEKVKKILEELHKKFGEPKCALNFFKEIIKIFLISGIIYYFPIVCTNIFWLFVEYY